MRQLAYGGAVAASPLTVSTVGLPVPVTDFERWVRSVPSP